MQTNNQGKLPKQNFTKGGASSRNGHYEQQQQSSVPLQRLKDMSPQAMAAATGALDEEDILKIETELNKVNIDQEK